MSLVVLLMSTASSSPAAPPHRSSPESAARWHVLATENFRLLSFGTRPISSQVGERCEAIRARLVRQWLGGEGEAWSPKCDLVLHPSDASYDREIGPGGANTIASALIDQRGNRVAVRRIDIRASHADWLNSALAHELTHVVLADRFSQEVLPRWLDEGIAILADSDAKRKRHTARVRADVSQGRHFTLAELLLMQGYPPAQRWGTFYDQSAALVEFLVAQQGHERLLEFAEIARKDGYDQAFRQVYAMTSVELERSWQSSLFGRTTDPGNRSVPVRPAGWKAPVSGG